MPSSTDVTPPTRIDGRHARRERGRIAAIDAMFDLVFEGHSPPTADQVAERADISVASLFRYFDTLDDLRRQVTEQCFERFPHLFDIPDIGVGPREKRIATFVAARVDQYEKTHPMARLMRTRESMSIDLSDTLGRFRATHTSQIGLHFENELRQLPPATRDDTVASVSMITSFESWDQFRHEHSRSAAQTRRAWTSALRALLGTPT